MASPLPLKGCLLFPRSHWSIQFGILSHQCSGARNSGEGHVGTSRRFSPGAGERCRPPIIARWPNCCSGFVSDKASYFNFPWVDGPATMVVCMWPQGLLTRFHCCCSARGGRAMRGSMVSVRCFWVRSEDVPHILDVTPPVDVPRVLTATVVSWILRE